MIISLRGPSGSGKSHLTRAVMARYEHQEPLFQTGKRKPAAYRLSADGQPPLYVLGHYEIANGGIDTLGDLHEAYRMIRSYDQWRDAHVLYEGKNMSDGATRLLELHEEGRKCMAVFLDTDPDECERSVRTRGHQLSRKSIDLVARKCARDHVTLARAGVECHLLSREAAMQLVLSTLGFVA